MAIKVTVASLVFGIATLGGCGEVDTECIRVCAELQRCGMLPSPLGLAQRYRSPEEDCVSRCSTSKMVDGIVNSCVDGEHDAETTTWCASGQCRAEAECLRTALGPDILGRGNVSLSWAVGVLQEKVSTEEDTVCPAEVDPPFVASAPASGLCESDCVPNSLRVQLESQHDVIPLGSGSCLDVVGVAFAASDVPVGIYRTATILDWGTGLGCSKLYGGEVLVQSGQVVSAVALWDEACPANTVPCDMCMGMDEDEDGLVGCQDPDCAPLCLEEGLACSDALDNDQDGLFDCSDPDCVEEFPCSSEESESGA